MSRPGYRCVGGPLNGQLRVVQEGHTWFEILETPRMPAAAYDPDAANLPINADLKRHRYTLCRLQDGSHVWGHQP